jgi:hypothetical protein
MRRQKAGTTKAAPMRKCAGATSRQGEAFMQSARRSNVWAALLFLIIISAPPFVFCASPQDTSTPPAEAIFKYKFENPRFYIPLIEIDMNANGAGELRFKRGESDEVIDRKLKLLPATIARIRQLYEATRFLESNEEYQDKKDFSHLGWVSLSARQGERERLAKFNYTTNKDITELSDIFRGIATQEMHLFDIETSEQFQPLDLPRLLDSLKNDLSLRRVAEPEQLLSKLREIADNDTQPLIARNSAKRIIDGIKKGDFKSPVKQR